MKETFADVIQKETEGLIDALGNKISPRKLVKLAGLSDGSYYNWKNGVTSPSDSAKAAILRKAASMRQRSLTPMPSRAIAAPAGKTLPEIMNDLEMQKAQLEKRIEAAKLLMV